jgi:hypothetical protein
MFNKYYGKLTKELKKKFREEAGRETSKIYYYERKFVSHKAWKC